MGGGIANTFMLAAGLSIGKSLAEPDLVDQARAVIEAMRARDIQFLDTPDTYFDVIDARVPDHGEDVERLVEDSA